MLNVMRDVQRRQARFVHFQCSSNVVASNIHHVKPNAIVLSLLREPFSTTKLPHVLLGLLVSDGFRTL